MTTWCMQCRTRHRMSTPHDAEIGGLIREWGDLPGPRTNASKVPDADMVQLPAVKCTRAQRAAWTRIAKLRGTTVSGLVRDMFERLERGERWEKDE